MEVFSSILFIIILSMNVANESESDEGGVIKREWERKKHENQPNLLANRVVDLLYYINVKVILNYVWWYIIIHHVGERKKEIKKKNRKKMLFL